MKHLTIIILTTLLLTSCAGVATQESVAVRDLEDNFYQNIPYSRIETIMRADTKVTWACAAVMDVKTGRVRFAGRKYDAEGEITRLNLAIAVDSLMEVGGVFRTATLLSLLDSGDVTVNDTYDYLDGKGEIDIGIYDTPKLTGEVSLRKAFLGDSDLGFTLGAEGAYNSDTEAKAFYDSLKNMGFDLDSESQKNSIKDIAIGRGFRAKPLQTLQLFSAIANGGKLLEHIYFLDDTTKVMNPQIASRKAIKTVGQLLVERGNRSGFDNVAMTMGRNSFTREEGKYSQTTTVVGYFPADKPRYAAIVSIENDNEYNRYALNIFAELVREMKATHYLLSSTMWNFDCCCATED